MKALFAAAAVMLVAGALSPVAWAEGPRPSSENNWPGMTKPAAVTGYASPLYQYQTPPGTAPHYEWREGYSHGGRWQGGWVLVQ
jgi:hypothetical protein